MGLLKRFWNWLKEPRRTPGEQWAIDNGVHDAWLFGYECGLIYGPNLTSHHEGYSEEWLRAFQLGFDDALFDLDRQW